MLTNSLILIGESLSLLSYKFIIRDMIKHHKYITYNGVAQNLIEDGIKYSKLMLKNLVIYNIIKYCQYKIPYIKYAGYLILSYAYYNKLISRYTLFSTKLTKRDKYLLNIGLLLTSIGFGTIFI